MKKIILLPFFILLSLLSFSDEDPFNIDTKAIEKKFEILNKFEFQYLKGEESLQDLEIKQNPTENTIKLSNKFELVKRAENTVSGVPVVLHSFLLGPAAVVLETSNHLSEYRPLVTLVACGMLVTAGTLIIIYAASYDFTGECAYIAGEACAEVAIEVLIEACLAGCSEACATW